MSPIDRFTDACVDSAARRWPVGIADLMASEWRAELAYARRDPHARRLARIWRQLTFALSLAMSPSGGSENPVTPRWQSRLTGLGPAAYRLTVLVGVAMLAYLLPGMSVQIWNFVSRQNEFGEPFYPMWLDTTVTTVLTVLILIAMVLLGTFTYRRLARSAGVGSAARAAIQLGLGFLLVDMIAYTGVSNRTSIGLSTAASIVFWTVCAAVLATIGARLARAGRVLLARAVTALGLLVVTDLATIVAQAHTVLRHHLAIVSGPLWLPASMTRYVEYTTSPHDVIGLVDDTVRADTLPLLLLSAFLVTYAIRRRAEVPADKPVAVPPATPRVPWASGPVRGYALGLAAVGLGLWTFVLAFVTAGPGPFATLWLLVGDRMSAIAFMLLAFVIYNAGRGPVSAPTAITGVLLFAADHVAGVRSWHGPVVAVGLMVFGAALLVGATALVPRLAGPGTTDITARRALVVAAVTAVCAVPAAVQWVRLTMRVPTLPVERHRPFLFLSATALLVLVLGCGLLLTVTGLIAALASRRHRFSTLGTIVAALVVGALYAAGTINADLLSLLRIPPIAFFIQVIIAVVFVAIARWPRRRRVRALAWTFAGCVGAGAAAVALSDSLAVVSRLFDGLLPDVLTTGRSSLDMVPRLLVGLVLALVFAKRLIPPDPTDVADPETAPIPLSPATA
jgi:hypothetical protein